jgi:hypothetical protein
MSSSSWKDYLGPQTATRNRWTDQHGTRPDDVAAAREGAQHVPGARNRGLAAAAAVALTVAAVVMFFVVALHSSTPEPLFTMAPAAPGPAPYSVTADSAEHAATAGTGGNPTAAPSAGGGVGGHAIAE